MQRQWVGAGTHGSAKQVRGWMQAGYGFLQGPVEPKFSGACAADGAPEREPRGAVGGAAAQARRAPRGHHGLLVCG